MVVSVQPSWSVAPLMMALSRLQASTPQLMKSIFFPVGIFLPTGAVMGIVPGRTLYLLTVALAASRPDVSTLVVVLFSPPPQAASTLTAVRAVMTPSQRAGLF